MTILGIHDGHDASACLLRDGEIILGSAEERRLNVKNFSGTPRESINALFARTGVKPSDVDLVAIGCRIRTRALTGVSAKHIHHAGYLFASFGRYQWSTSLGQWMLSKRGKRQDLFNFLNEIGVSAPNIVLDHHQTHAACAYYHRPWSEPTLVLTNDGAGDGLCATVYKGGGNALELVARTPKYHSIANQLYSTITAHLGLKPWEHEYKVMGMAPYGQAEHCIDRIENLFTIDGLEFRNKSGAYGVGMEDLLYKRLRGQRFDNIAAACQQVFERLVVQWVRNAIAATGIRNVACAGGAFLNVKANKLIRELPEVDKFYVYPASDDGGTSVGAAVLGYLHLCKQKNVAPGLKLPRDMYLGLGFSDDECLSAIKKFADVEYRKMDNVAEEVAELLEKKNIVGRFAGREEWGPRALGNRSILADPRDMGIIRKLNFAIKHRDFWMPFAASILEEDRETYMTGDSAHAFYMIEAFDTKQPAGELIVAGTHPFDKTVRPQLVNELNPQYQAILRAFKRRTGIGAVLNTSFNLHGSPIVGTPEVAIDTLRNSALDALALGSYLVWRKGSPPVE